MWRKSFLAAAERMPLWPRSARPNPAPRPVVLGGSRGSAYDVGNIIGGSPPKRKPSCSSGSTSSDPSETVPAPGILMNTWALFRLPEAKDRTFVELDVMFLRKIPARRFAVENMGD